MSIALVLLFPRRPNKAPTSVAPTRIPTISLPTTKSGHPTLTPTNSVNLHTNRPTVLSTLSIAPSSTQSNAPTKRPVPELPLSKATCLKEMKQGCNCGLFWNGSKCYNAILDHVCHAPNRSYKQTVTHNYQTFCQPYER
jgi:hypothetical protein